MGMLRSGQTAPHALRIAVALALVGCGGGAPHGQVALTRAKVVLVGESGPDWTGTAVAGAGDVNGDGVADMVVGNEFVGEGGSAYLVYGPIDRNRELAEADVVLRTSQSGAELGQAVAPAGDLNDDGIGDVVIGAPALSNDEIAGAAYVLFGPVERGERDIDSVPSLRISSSSPYDWVGHVVAAGGDMSGDGVDDLIVGATPFFGQQPVNAAFVFYGPLDVGAASAVAADGAVYSDNNGYIMKQARYQASAGDVDGDGIGDLVVGGFQDGVSEAGRIYVLHGPIQGVLRYSDADLIVEGEHDFGNVGLSVSAVSDIDGDGTSDLLIGAPAFTDGSFNQPGEAYVMSGNLTGQQTLGDAHATLLGELGGDLVGFDVASAGDVDADGFEDVLIAAPLHANGNGLPGATYLYYGPLEGTLSTRDADATFTTASPAGGSGAWVGGAGDVDADGFDDVVIGGFLDRGNEFEATAFLFFGGSR